MAHAVYAEEAGGASPAGPVRPPEYDAVWNAHVAVTAATQGELFNGAQGAPEWKAARMHRVGASQNLAFLGSSAKTSAEETCLAMAYGGLGAGANYFTAQGSRNEPRNRGAVLAWLRATGFGATPGLRAIREVLSVDCGLLVWLENPCMSCSSDGHIIVLYDDGTYDVLNSELKCPVLTGGYGDTIPPEHRTQMLQQMGIHSRSPGFGPLDLATSMLAQWAAERPGRPAEFSLVPGWTYRTMYATWQRGALLHVSIVDYDDAAFVALAAAIIGRYYVDYLPILAALDAGRITFPQLSPEDPVYVFPAEDARLMNDVLGDLDALDAASAGAREAIVDAAFAEADGAFATDAEDSGDEDEEEV